MLPEGARNYLLHGLEATPIVIDRMMRAATPADYDRRPDPERFTLREVMAHLADCEPIWLERMEAIRSQSHPTLPNRDEGQLAIDHDYAHADVAAKQHLFREGRARLVRFLRDLAPAEWDRTAQHTLWGPVTLGSLVALILGHDGYHLRQIAEWLAAGE
jgi:uncharacterized damage-inducible protein DinB